VSKYKHIYSKEAMQAELDDNYIEDCSELKNMLRQQMAENKKLRKCLDKLAEYHAEGDVKGVLANIKYYIDWQVKNETK